MELEESNKISVFLINLIREYNIDVERNKKNINYSKRIYSKRGDGL